MTPRHLVWEAAWFDAYRDLAREDLTTARLIRTQVNALARDPEPVNSVHWGNSPFYRLHIDDWRVLYEVDDDTIRVWSLGRAASP